jgi:hypothetical protein
MNWCNMSHGSGAKLLEYRNNWEMDEFSVVDQTHDGKRLGSKPIKDLRKVRIHFKLYDVTSREVSVPYSDHSVRSVSTSKHYFVQETVFGSKIEFDLGKLMRVNKVVAFAEEWDEL